MVHWSKTNKREKICRIISEKQKCSKNKGWFKKGHKLLKHNPKCKCFVCCHETAVKNGKKWGKVKHTKERKEKRKKTMLEKYGWFGYPKGKPRSEKTKRKISEKLTGIKRKKHTKKWKEMMSKICKERDLIKPLQTIESRKKANETKRRKYDSGELIIWNKGLK